MSTFYERALPEGASGYFSEPAATLDPSLFDGTHLKDDVRQWLILTLAHGLASYLDLSGVNEWLHAWLAGSGITYQWAADRGNGDLDVLFGVDMARFVHFNPDYQGIPERDVADYENKQLKMKLWPSTAHQRFNGRSYEVTFYWAPGTGSDISRIHPYAAYDLKRDAWVVHPPQLPADPRALYPSEWFEAAGRDTTAAEQLARRHASLLTRLASTTLSEGRARNAHAELTRVRQSVTSLFDEIHGGRAAAFGEQGQGYGDFANFRWQHAKQTGVVAALKDIRDQARADAKADDHRLYGDSIDGASAILNRDIMRPRP